MDDPQVSPKSWLDHVEKAARVVLWLSIASACVIAPIQYISFRNAEKRAATKAEAELQELVKKGEARVEEREKRTKSRRLTLASMGAYISGLSYSAAQGNLWVTNVSPRTGVLCVYGVAQDPEGSKTSESLPVCHEVGAYAASTSGSLGPRSTQPDRLWTPCSEAHGGPIGAGSTRSIS